MVKDLHSIFNMNCKDCRFFIPGLYAETGFCKRFYAYRGRGRIVYEFASQARVEMSKCGPRARFYVPKNGDDKKNSVIFDSDDDD